MLFRSLPKKHVRSIRASTVDNYQTAPVKPVGDLLRTGVALLFFKRRGDAARTLTDVAIQRRNSSMPTAALSLAVVPFASAIGQASTALPIRSFGGMNYGSLC